MLEAKLRAPRGLRNPGGFDPERNALAQGIAATGYVADAENAKRIGIAHGLDAWREAMSSRIARQAPADSAQFLRAFALAIPAACWTRTGKRCAPMGSPT